MADVVGLDLFEGLDRGGQVGERPARRLGEALGTERGDREGRVGALPRGQGGRLVAFVVIAPEIEDPVEGIVESIALLRRRHAEGLEHRFLEAATEPDQQPTAGQLVEGGDLRRDLLGRVQGEEQRRGPEAEALGPRGVPGELDERCRTDAGLEVHLGQPHRMESDLLGEIDPVSMASGLVGGLGAAQGQSESRRLQAPGASSGGEIEGIGGRGGGGHALDGIPRSGPEKAAPGPTRRRENQPAFV